jgi:hypothetical protein
MFAMQQSALWPTLACRYSLSNDKRMRQFALPSCTSKNINDLLADEWRSLTSEQKAQFTA